MTRRKGPPLKKVVGRPETFQKSKAAEKQKDGPGGGGFPKPGRKSYGWITGERGLGRRGERSWPGGTPLGWRHSVERSGGVNHLFRLPTEEEG